MSNYTPLVTIYTQVYNNKQYIDQCIQSVLNQTYNNIEYIVLDNACTDGTSEILEMYAQKDSRIRLYKNEVNQLGLTLEYLCKYASGQFVMTLDSDDWIEETCIESLLDFTLKNDLDITATGTIFHDDRSNDVLGERRSPKSFICTRKQFPDFYPSYHVFFRAVWGKLIKKEIIPYTATSIRLKEYLEKGYTYGADTIQTFSFLRNCHKIGVVEECLHHYRLHQKSISHHYNAMRFASDVILYEDALNFLKSYGSISPKNQLFINIVYCNATIDTLKVIDSSSLTPQLKMNEYLHIASHPYTQSAYTLNQSENHASISARQILIKLALISLFEDSSTESSFKQIIFSICPLVSHLVDYHNAKLLADPNIFEAFCKNNPDELLQSVLNVFSKQTYHLKMLSSQLVYNLCKNNPLLSSISEPSFLIQYSFIYQDILKKEYLNALNEMTDILLNKILKTDSLTFLELYLNLAAITQEESAYLFGKIRFAEYLFSKKRYAECSKAIAELEQMGLSEHEEVKKLKKELSRHT